MFDCKKFLLKLAEQGVREIILCAGARNAEFVQALERARGVQLYHFFEERAAGFFALGKARASGRPVAIITTSGTAVAELLPAAIEAFYQEIPLYFVTADRPKKFRGSGAPQAIRQSKLLQGHVSLIVDTAKTPTVDWSSLPQGASIHFNISLPEPVDVSDLEEWNWPRTPFSKKNERSLVEIDQKVFKKIKRPVVIVGGLEPTEHSIVRQFLERSGLPFVAEGPSGLREESAKLIRVPDKTLPSMASSGSIDSVIRVGSVPTLRFWRDLDLEFKDQPVLNFSRTRWTGLSRIHDRPFSIGQLEPIGSENFLIDNGLEHGLKPDLKRDRELSHQVDALVKKYPQSEPAFFRSISQFLNDSSIYVGNSLPIREWDLCADFSKNSTVIANRGANGIDGQVSSFIGSDCSWGIFGDLTTMYDLSAPWALKYIEKPKTFFVINNNGGQIFARKFSQKSFLNQHEIDFSNWAKMWGMDYSMVGQRPGLESEPDEVWQNLIESNNDSHRLIEVRPCLEQTNAFWKAYEELVF